MAGSFAEGREAVPRAAPGLALMDVLIGRTLRTASNGSVPSRPYAERRRPQGGVASPVMMTHDPVHPEGGEQEGLARREADMLPLKTIRDALGEQA